MVSIDEGYFPFCRVRGETRSHVDIQGLLQHRAQQQETAVCDLGWSHRSVLWMLRAAMVLLCSALIELRLKRWFHCGGPCVHRDLAQCFSDCGPQDQQHQHPTGIC